MNTTERFRLIRTGLGHSFRSMSAAIGGSPGLWAQYEGGRRNPSFEALERLSALGVNIDWLVAGRGQMFVGSPTALPTPSSDGFSHILKALELVLEHHDRQRFRLWSTIVGILSRSMDGMAVDELARQAGLPPSDPGLITQLAWLQSQGLIGSAKGVYRLIRSSFSLEGSGAEFQGLLAVRDMLSQIIPALRDGVGRSKLMRIAQTPVSGPVLERLNELVKQLRRLDNEMVVQPGSARTQTVQLIYAYLVTD